MRLLVVGVVVLVAAVGAGVLLRESLPGAGTAGAASIANNPPLAPREPGPPTVAMVDDVAVHPDANQVRALLQKYFDAINAGDYKLWRSTVTARQARETGESAWREQYRSTLDGNIVLHRLEPRADGGLIALLAFTSVQSPADAPPELPVRCLRWWGSYPLISEGDQLRLSPTSPSADLRMPC